MLYEIADGTVTAGGETVLSHIHFEIKGKEKIGQGKKKKEKQFFP